MRKETFTVPSSLRFPVNGDALCLVALAVAGFLILAGGLLRRLRPRRLWGLPACCLLGSVGILAAPGFLRAGLGLFGLIGLVLLAATGALLPSSPGPGSTGNAPAARRGPGVPVLAACLLAAAIVLFRGLGDPAQFLNVWEPSVLLGFQNEMTGGPPGVTALAGRLLWQQGLLSTGGDSLLYGFPTLLLLSGQAASVLSLRLVATLLALASALLCWVVTRRLFGDAAAYGAVLLWLLSPPFLFFGRYGTSVTAMWATLWLALWAVSALVSRPSPARAALAALALYAATLEYAPGRVVVVALLGLVLVLLPGAEATRRDKGLAALVLVAALSAVLVVNARYERIFSFYAVRGEQLFGFRHHLEAVQTYLGSTDLRGTLPWSETARLALRVIASNLPAYGAYVFPLEQVRLYGEPFFVDPPHFSLLLRAAVPLVLWGAALSFRRGSGAGRLQIGLLAAFVLASLPLLLTNRVDVARAGGLLPFLALWGGRGAADLVGRLATAARRPVAAAVAVLFVFGGAADVASATLPAAKPRNTTGESLLAGMAAIDGPVRLGVNAPHYEAMGCAWLAALDRLRRRGEFLPALLDPVFVSRLASDPESQPGVVEAVIGEARLTPLLLGPSGDFGRLRPLLSDRGVKVTPAGTEEFPLLRIEMETDAARPQGVK